MSSSSRSIETWHLAAADAGPLIRAVPLGKKHTWAKGEFLYRQGDVDTRFHFVLRGHVQIFAAREDGSEFVLEVMGRWAICMVRLALKPSLRLASCCSVLVVNGGAGWRWLFFTDRKSVV